MRISITHHNAFAMLAAALIQQSPPTVSATNRQFLDLISKMEVDVLELAKEVESIYTSRCTNINLGSCSQGNYDHCLSSLPRPECLEAPERRISQCGDPSGTCSASWDFSSSNVWLPTEVANGRDGNPTDKEVIESICLTQSVDNYFIQKRAQDADFWRAYNTEPHGAYFGSKEGAFRIFPARAAQSCGLFDPRVRPWYVAGGSGPKNVIMILDVSGSMDGRRLQFLKTAAKRVVNTLGINDRIAIVPFSSSASVIGNELFTATDDNKRTMVREIDNLSANGATNFRAAFRTTFDLLDRSYVNEDHIDCNTALLFLTDGVMTDNGVSPETVMEEIAEGIAERQDKSGNPIILFTYSVSDSSSVDQFPKDLSCRVENGIWTKISKESQIVEGLSNYYRLFSLGLSQSEDFVTWVQPYVYSTGGILGTTVSAPTYDRTLDPPVFLGVVAIDFTLSSLDTALGNEIGSQATVDEFIARPAICPRLDLTKCMLESFRKQGLGGEDALCHAMDQNSTCTEDEFAQFEPEDCGIQADYPSNLWVNTDYARRTYEERVCCELGNEITGPEDVGVCSVEPSKEELSTGAIIGISVGTVAGFCILCVALFLCKKNHIQKHEGQQDHNKSNATMEGAANNDDFSNLEAMKPPARNPSAPIGAQ